MISNPRANRIALMCGALMVILAGATAAVEQSLYPSPDAAVKALIEAAGSEDRDAILAILGPGAEDLRSGDPVADAEERRAFVEATDEGARIEQEGDDLAMLSIGNENWPFPIPLVRAPDGWRFDAAAGKEELLNRRVGRNELHAIAVTRVYVDAQYEYAAEDRNGDGIRQFAQKLMSDEGTRDGLFWPTAEGEPQSPMGRLVAEAVAKGYQPGESAEPSPYQGYYYRVLTAQGENAPGGSKEYVDNGHMTKGFGLLAHPAEYGNSGITTFMVNQSGILFQKDLGEETPSLAADISTYDPDESWQPVTD
ncbi:MAG: DUF2950 domain-containing protein [Pseudomonadota bacterium]|nr:DUF2950 domain-containing protein [Pseudomonadota bacterium]